MNIDHAQKRDPRKDTGVPFFHMHHLFSSGLRAYALTVGTGVSPVRHFRVRGLAQSASPPVWNLTKPQRYDIQLKVVQERFRVTVVS